MALHEKTRDVNLKEFMYCEKCGTLLDKNKCPNCGFEKYFNPTPVAVALVPVKKDGKIYLLGVKRGIEPQKGALTLPGGFQEIESIQEATVRELLEETNINLKNVPLHKNSLVLSTTDRTKVLIFSQFDTVPDFSDIDFTFKNDETQGIVLLDENSQLGFPLHQIALKWFYENK